MNVWLRKPGVNEFQSSLRRQGAAHNGRVGDDAEKHQNHVPCQANAFCA